ncbi:MULTISPECIES: RecQ family ATP-dependent DNA helicase [Vagococcus]|uniref:ATP-dependent DNA helicase RecQ n=1 Tax=Vagococcus fluvialis bH819 TaxID=1255619 RepID=A0A1X6WRG2_9ENTE|nr:MULTISPECIES: RecQ family ATP-dependent DNA helicase [Vagococcus]SLM86867.1 ATP-dependent DNA helicase RecQ [Vagococcus fluvialis bH819]HCM88676.1 ATP-dependent DNA helicase RecQ [Vagococcus sp.]
MNNLEEILKNKFGFSTFKIGQKETIESLLRGENTFTILPTGTGKSLCYQLPSYLFNGQTVIISPLISLMEDQVSQLREMGEKSVIALNSTLDFSSKKYVLSNLEKFKFIFVSPETLNQSDVIQKFMKLSISLFVIDEAHCISEWGHDFRPSYLELKACLSKLNNPLTLALTATATESVAKDIEEEIFSSGELTKFSYSVNRENIFYQVKSCEDKTDYLLNFLKNRNIPGIIYFSSKKEAERVSSILNNQLPYKVAFYHGDVAAIDRMKIQQQFIKDDIRILCATSAFGMGVNKKNVRFVIHYHLPDSLENYVQESGRAGRDGKQSLSILLYQSGDERIHYYLQEESFNQKKDLLFLKGKTKDELKKYENILTDIQKKWLVQLEKSHWDWELFEKNIRIKQFEKKNKTQKMGMYINSFYCRRQFILNYFNSSYHTVKQEVCCDKCQLEIPGLEEAFNQEKNTEVAINSKEILKKLFLI